MPFRLDPTSGKLSFFQNPAVINDSVNDLPTSLPDGTNRVVLPQLNTSMGFISANSASAVTVAGYGIATLQQNLSPWDGVVCEIVSYGSTLTLTDRQKMEGYIA